MKIRKVEVLSELPTPSKVPLGGIVVDVGNAYKYPTGSWRTQRPMFNAEACTNCLLCWINCPDGSILVPEGKVSGIDQNHCKGCGICAQVCPTKPVKAMTMAQGGEY